VTECESCPAIGVPAANAEVFWRGKRSFPEEMSDLSNSATERGLTVIVKSVSPVRRERSHKGN